MTTFTGFSAEDEAELAFVLEHLEGNHADTLLFVASQARETDRSAWRAATVTGLDRTGIEFLLQSDDGECRERLDFDAEATSLMDMQGQFFGLLIRARAAFPDDPMSSLEEEFEQSTTIRTRVGSVVRSTRITPSFVEVTIGGLDGQAVLGGDEFFYLMVPTEPDAIADGALFSEVEQLPAGTFVGASYTTRRRRPDEGELDVWILLHGHDGGVSGWAAEAAVGDTVAVWGPRRSYEPPATTSSHLLVCDETGIPAVCAIVETLPADHPVTVVAEAVDAKHRPALPEHPALATRWVDRGTGEAGAGRLLDVVRELDLPPDGLYAFGAAESREISAVRRHLRNQCGLPAEQVHMTGYWRR
ncbi:MAG: hypothetical protein CL424_14075 [Acidimicrobiaceae bacterium]|nr:hypothetical protein [Acidimicrobiaceae bacterium]